MQLYDMVGHCRDVAPTRPKDMLARYLNRRIRQVTTRRAWTDLIQLTTVNFVTPYNTGLISLNTGSNVVTGGGPDANGNFATWPVNDYINTVAAGQFNAVRQPGYIRITPASMTGIVPGQWLLIDQNNNPEAVAVEWTDSSSFIAQYALTHDIGFSITASSFAGLQVQPAYPLMTITAVINPTTLWMDQNWAGPAQSLIPYNILTGYVQPTPYAWRVKFCVDPYQGVPLDCDSNTYEEILISDPQLTSSANPAIVAPCPFPAGGQVAQFLTYPLILAPYFLNMIVVNSWPKLINDTDRSPGFLDAQMFIAGAMADSLRTKVISRPGETDPYFDKDLAAYYEGEFERYVEVAEEKDEALSHHRLQSYQLTAAGSFSAAYWQAHPLWPSDFNFGG